MSLGDSTDVREATFASLKLSREQLVSKFRQCITDALYVLLNIQNTVGKFMQVTDFFGLNSQ